MKKIIQNTAFVIGASVGLLIFVGVNIYVDKPTGSICFDCYETFGFPFKYLGAGGFASGTDIFWFGLIADIFVAVIFSVLIGAIFILIWSKLKRKLVI